MNCHIFVTKLMLKTDTYACAALFAAHLQLDALNVCAFKEGQLFVNQPKFPTVLL